MQFWDGDDPRGRDGAEFLVVGTTGIHTADAEDIERVQLLAGPREARASARTTASSTARSVR
jgi:hypothetical protein